MLGSPSSTAERRLSRASARSQEPTLKAQAVANTLNALGPMTSNFQSPPSPVRPHKVKKQKSFMTLRQTMEASLGKKPKAHLRLESSSSSATDETSASSTSSKAKEQWNPIQRLPMKPLDTSSSEHPAVPPTPPAKSPHRRYLSSSSLNNLPLPPPLPPKDSEKPATKPVGLANIPILPHYPVKPSVVDENHINLSSLPADDTVSRIVQRDRSGSINRPALARRASLLTFSVASPTHPRIPADNHMLPRKLSDMQLSARRPGTAPSAHRAGGAPLVFTPAPDPSSRTRTSSDSSDDTLSYIPAYFDANDKEPHVFRLSYSQFLGPNAVAPPASTPPAVNLTRGDRPFRDCLPSFSADASSRVPTESRKEQTWVGTWNRNDMTEVMNGLRELRG